MSGISGPKIITSGCVLSLDAADKLSYKGSGTTWKDLSGNNNTGTLTNGPTFNAGNMGSIVFDGTNDYVGFTYNSIFNPSTSVTLSIWLRLTASDTTIRNPIELSGAASIYFGEPICRLKDGGGELGKVTILIVKLHLPLQTFLQIFGIIYQW
jgi:hypothetical protein